MIEYLLKIRFLYPKLLFIAIPLILLLLFLIFRTFVKFEKPKQELRFKKEKKLDRAFILVTRIIMILLLTVAIASPFTLTKIIEKGDPDLKILVDKSASFELFDTEIGEKIKKQIGSKIPVQLITIDSGNRSSIGNALRNQMQGDDNILLITDGNNNEGWNLGDAILFANNRRTSVSSLNIEPIHNDAAVTIYGPSEVIRDTENEYIVNVDVAGELKYRLIIEINDKEEINQEFDKATAVAFKKILSQGYHKITAKIIAKDYFPQNNVFRKTVHVLPKPQVLFVTGKTSPISSILENMYNIEKTNSLPINLDKYHAIILNDINKAKLENRVEDLKKFLDKGNGLVVIGGENSYDLGNYKDSLFESILPVRVGTGTREDTSGLNIIFTIDISGSTGESFNQNKKDTKVSVEKALAIEMLKQLDPNDRVGLIVFNHQYNLIQNPTPYFQTPDLNSTIAKLRFFGGTNIPQGLIKARDVLSKVDGTKVVILLSDGLTQNPSQALSLAKDMGEQGITIHSVGVGFDTRTIFMQTIAENGNGLYFQPTEAEKLGIVLGKNRPEAENRFALNILNKNHFITNNLELNAYVSGYNQVVPKKSSSARTIVSIENNNPILSVWQFGIGRVASISTDDGSKWSGGILNKKNSKLITKTLNWAIGDPERKSQFKIKIDDTSIGESTEINVISQTEPILKGYKFSKIELENSKSLFTTTFTPKTTGFFTFFNAVTAVNYNKEYEKVGINSELETLVTSSGGGFFNPDEIDKIIEKVKTDSKRIKTDYKFYRWPLIIAAIIIFLIEITFRRIRENKNR